MEKLETTTACKNKLLLTVFLHLCLGTGKAYTPLMYMATEKQDGKGVEVVYFRQKPCGKCDLGQNHGTHKAQ